MLAEGMVDVTDYIARDELISAIDVAVAQGRLSAATGRSAVAIAEEQPRVKIDPVRQKAYWTGKNVQRVCSYCGMPIPTTAIDGDPLPEEQLHYCYNCGCRMGITE